MPNPIYVIDFSSSLSGGAPSSTQLLPLNGGTPSTTGAPAQMLNCGVPGGAITITWV